MRNAAHCRPVIGARVLIDGEWCRESNAEPGTRTLKMKLGDFFLAEVKPGQGDLAGCWVVTLNGQKIGAHIDMEWAKGRAECEICNRLHNVRHAFIQIKQRAPTSSDLYRDGNWERFKAARN